jgi:hypothetical protein
VAECVILIGLPGAGKTTFFRERFAATHDHVSKDLLRNTRYPSRRQPQLLEASLAAGRPVVVDRRGCSGRRSRRAHGSLPQDAERPRVLPRLGRPARSRPR